MTGLNKHHRGKCATGNLATVFEIRMLPEAHPKTHMIIRTFSYSSKAADEEIHRVVADPEGGARAGTVLALHGLGDHSGCHFKAFELFCDLGYRVESFDWPGNGLSGGRRGDIPGVVPALRLLEEIVASFDRPPRGIYAHSAGGFLALPFVSSHAGEMGLDWIWLNAPLVRPTHNQSRFKVAVSKFLADWAPRLTVPTGVRPSQCFDIGAFHPGVAREMLKDCHTRVSVGFGRDLILWEPKIVRAAASLEDPLQLLLTQGRDDQICPSQFAEDLFATIPLSRKTLIVCDSLRHEPLREPDNAEFLEQARNWLAKVTAGN